MHDLVLADLARYGDDPAARQLRQLLIDRRDIGLTRYGSLLQSGNGRDPVRDLAEEIADAIVYARQCRMEGHEWAGGMEQILIVGALSMPVREA
jgi:hypothetical protein